MLSTELSFVGFTALVLRAYYLTRRQDAFLAEGFWGRGGWSSRCFFVIIYKGERPPGLT